jgi:electron transport complex protein RnfE
MSEPKKKQSLLQILLNGIIFENPVMVLLLGTCPTLATSTSAINGIGMGVATTFVLICSNVVISLLRKLIPSKIRIASYIVVIATFVTIVQLLLQAYVPALYNSLGLFIPLIVVNCIVLGRAEAFASKNGPLVSLVDGLGMGLGFTLTLAIMGLIREFLGAGTLFGVQIYPSQFAAMYMTMPFGGFLTLGCVIAAVQFIRSRGKKGEK